MKLKCIKLTDAAQSDYYFDLNSDESDGINEMLDVILSADVGDRLKIKVVELTEEELEELKD